MDISSISKTIAAGKLSGAKLQTQGIDDPVGQAFQKADKRIQQQRDLTSVQVSSFGSLKSSFADTQAASRDLSDEKKIASNSDLKKATNTFVGSFNSATKAAKTAASSQATVAENNNARKAESDLRKTVTGDSALTADLKKIGVSQQKDGSLAIDTKKFDAALQSDPTAARATLAKLGKETDVTTTRQLSKGGNLGSAVDSVNNRARSLERQQTTQQDQASAAQQSSSTQIARLNNVSNTGAAAYQRIFSI